MKVSWASVAFRSTFSTVSDDGEFLVKLSDVLAFGKLRGFYPPHFVGIARKYQRVFLDVLNSKYPDSVDGRRLQSGIQAFVWGELINRQPAGHRLSEPLQVRVD